ncbi:Striatin-3 [Lonchura striata]|uniref:Striatin-3 n=1 Tax=Lonchura striata TaxID=40157 RepID=A0A218U8E7_9PASE|nr:Striatin-3 [Lonchura striata domestica]
MSGSHDCSLRLWHLCPLRSRLFPAAVAPVPAQVTTVLSGCGTCARSGHDCSLRLWHLCPLRCVQELPAHRRKHHEAVLAVAFHPRRPLGASAGADGLAKVFV